MFCIEWFRQRAFLINVMDRSPCSGASPKTPPEPQPLRHSGVCGDFLGPHRHESLCMSATMQRRCRLLPHTARSCTQILLLFQMKGPNSHRRDKLCLALTQICSPSFPLCTQGRCLPGWPGSQPPVPATAEGVERRPSERAAGLQPVWTTRGGEALSFCVSQAEHSV